MRSLTLDDWKIKKCLADMRMTRKEFCRLTGISQSNYSSMLRNGGRVRPKTAGLIADALGVDVEEILVLPGEEKEGGGE